MLWFWEEFWEEIWEEIWEEFWGERLKECSMKNGNCNSEGSHKSITLLSSRDRGLVAVEFERAGPLYST